MPQMQSIDQRRVRHVFMAGSAGATASIALDPTYGVAVDVDTDAFETTVIDWINFHATTGVGLTETWVCSIHQNDLVSGSYSVVYRTGLIVPLIAAVANHGTIHIDFPLGYPLLLWDQRSPANAPVVHTLSTSDDKRISGAFYPKVEVTGNTSNTGILTIGWHRETTQNFKV